MHCCVFPDLPTAAHSVSNSGLTSAGGGEHSSFSFSSQIGRAILGTTRTSSRALSSRQFCGCATHGIGLRLKSLTVRAESNLSGKGNDDGDKDVQEMLVEIVRLETGKVRVNEFVEERSKHLTDIAEEANAEYDRIAEEARRTMDEAGSKVLEEMEIKASAFEEELAAARAEIEADEADLAAFEKNVEQARSEGLFFKELYKTVKAKTPEEQKQIKEKAEVVTKAVISKSAGSKSRRTLNERIVELLPIVYALNTVGRLGEKSRASCKYVFVS